MTKYILLIGLATTGVSGLGICTERTCKMCDHALNGDHQDARYITAQKHCPTILKLPNCCNWFLQSYSGPSSNGQKSVARHISGPWLYTRMRKVRVMDNPPPAPVFGPVSTQEENITNGKITPKTSKYLLISGMKEVLKKRLEKTAEKSHNYLLISGVSLLGGVLVLLAIFISKKGEKRGQFLKTRP